MQSEAINELATALAKAQGEIKAAAKSAENPFFDSQYADLPSVMACCREQLSKNGLSVIQCTEFDATHAWLETTLVHSSGQWVRSRYPIKPAPRKDKITKEIQPETPQDFGSALTYARRYALAAIVGVVAENEDDDANAASGQTAKGTTRPDKGQAPRQQNTPLPAAALPKEPIPDFFPAGQASEDLSPPAGDGPDCPDVPKPDLSGLKTVTGVCKYSAAMVGKEKDIPKFAAEIGGTKYGTFDLKIGEWLKSYDGQAIQVHYSSEAGTKANAGKTFLTIRWCEEA